MLVIIGLYIARELKCLYHLNHLKKQGIKTMYIPFLGYGILFRRIPGSKNQLSEIKRVTEENKEEPLIAFNAIKTTYPCVQLHDVALIRELFIKEPNIAIKTLMLDNVNLGFFFQNGHEADFARSMYSEFFSFDNLKDLTQSISSVFLKHAQEFKKKHQMSQKKVKFNPKELLAAFFEKFACVVLLGEEETKFVGEDQSVTSRCVQYVDEAFSIQVRPLTLLTMEYLHNLGLQPDTRRAMKILAQLEEVCYSLFKKRQVDGPKKKVNLLDLLVKFNRQRISEGKAEFTRSEITGHFILLQFAGSDTTLQVTTNALMLMSKNQKLQERTRGLTSQLFRQGQETLSFDDIYSAHEFEQVVNEYVRLGAPIPFISRQLIQDTTLGPYHFVKGTRFMSLSHIMHNTSKYYDNPEEFQWDRMTSEEISKKRGAYIPFGIGKRVCVGKGLADITIRLVLAHMLREFDLAEDLEGDQAKLLEGLSFGWKSPSCFFSARSL